MESSLAHAIDVLGQDLYVVNSWKMVELTNLCYRFSMKLYWVALSALCLYEYFLTLDREVKYAWNGPKNYVFYLYLMNRYLPLIFVVITLIGYFLDEFDHGVSVVWLHVCRYTILTTLPVFVGLRVYALSKRRKVVLYTTAFVLAWQWGIAIYAMSQSSLGTDQVQLLLPMDGPPPPVLPELPKTDPYHICIFISVITVAPWVEAFLCISLAFDGIAFLAIAYYSFKIAREQGHQVTDLLRIILRDGVVYFFVLFSSNLVWLLILLYARSSLKFIHAHLWTSVSAIMINRITLNLKEAASDDNDHVEGWSVRTFEQAAAYKKYGDRMGTDISQQSATLTGDIEMI
ncbi:hypothetical protein PM082_020723 [Marasmius tenuissimus]|nr:hypothetical protein PM082_020723 [Marasmius tenuissimus]